MSAPNLDANAVFSLDAQLRPTLFEGLPLLAGFTQKPFTVGGEDTPENLAGDVARNRETLHHALSHAAGQSLGPLRVLNQVHGKRVALNTRETLLETDAQILDAPFVPGMTLMADCVPILLYDPVAHKGALVHAGWRGTALSIVSEAVAALVTHYGVTPNTIRAAIGPAIGRSSFDVTRHVVEDLATSLLMTAEAFHEAGFAEEDADDFLKHWVDLKAVNAEQLRRSGVEQIEILPVCTVKMNHKYYSHRQGDAGRQCGYMLLL